MGYGYAGQKRIENNKCPILPIQLQKYRGAENIRFCSTHFTLDLQEERQYDTRKNVT